VPGVVLEGDYDTARLEVDTTGASFESLHLPFGMIINRNVWSGDGGDGGDGGSVTMTKCTFTGETIDVQKGASLVMTGSRAFDIKGFGVRCIGYMKATRCSVEGNKQCGAICDGDVANIELVDCVIRKNGGGSVVCGWARAPSCCAAAGSARTRGRRVCNRQRHDHGGQGDGGQGADLQQGQPEPWLGPEQ